MGRTRATSPRTTGGSLNVFTKSGSNDFRGSVFGYFRPDGLEASYTQLSSVNGTVNTTGSSIDRRAPRRH